MTDSNKSSMWRYNRERNEIKELPGKEPNEYDFETYPLPIEFDARDEQKALYQRKMKIDDDHKRWHHECENPDLRTMDCTDLAKNIWVHNQELKDDDFDIEYNITEWSSDNGRISNYLFSKMKQIKYEWMLDSENYKDWHCLINKATAIPLPSKGEGKRETVEGITQQEIGSLRWLLNKSDDLPGIKLQSTMFKNFNKDGVTIRADLENMWNKLKAGANWQSSQPPAPDKEEPWVKVEDGLPELTDALTWYNDETNQREVAVENYQVTVLGFRPEVGVFKAVRTKTGWSEVSNISRDSTVKPTHWMPLPQPPKK